MIELTPEYALKAAEEMLSKAVEIAEGSPEGTDLSQAMESLAKGIGFETGRTMGMTAAAIQAGYVEGYEAYLKENGIDDEGRKLTGGSKPLTDCEDCQCNYCAKLEACVRHREGAEKIRKDGTGIPWPCVGCKPGSQFICCANDEPDCPDFEEMDGTNYT